MPDGHDTARNGFTDRWNFHFDGHARELRKLIERRGRETFRQQSTASTCLGFSPGIKQD